MKQEIIRKLSAAVAMSLVVGVSLAACGGSSSSTAAGVTKTGSAEGFGGAVTATLTVDANGTVTDCKLEGAQETESIGGAALEELSKQVVAANGPAIDGVAGATVTSKAVRKAVAAALGVEPGRRSPRRFCCRNPRSSPPPSSRWKAASRSVRPMLPPTAPSASPKRWLW